VECLNNDVHRGIIFILGGGFIATGSLFSNSNIEAQMGQVACAEVGSGAIWGSYTAELFPNSTWYAYNGATFTASCLLTTGAIKFINGGTSYTTGHIYNASTGLWDSGIALNPTQIDDAGAVIAPKMVSAYTNGSN